jgi:hypothetical protein
MGQRGSTFECGFQTALISSFPRKTSKPDVGETRSRRKQMGNGLLVRKYFVFVAIVLRRLQLLKMGFANTLEEGPDI